MRNWVKSFWKPSPTELSLVKPISKSQKYEPTVIQDFLKQAELGNLDAKYNLASVSLTQPNDTTFARQFMPNPIQALKDLAEAQHGPSMLELARLFLSGWPDKNDSETMPEDYSNLFEPPTKLITQSVTESRLEPNQAMALELLERLAALHATAQKGDLLWGISLEAIILLRTLYFEKGDIAQAHAFLKQGAASGDVSSLFVLANWYSTGQYPEFVPKNEAKAFGLFQFIAEKSGLVLAIHNLAVCYVSGAGCEVNAQLAMEHFERASAKGYLPSKFNLASIYANGDVVEKDVAHAIMLYTDIYTSEVKGVDDLKTKAYDAKRALEKEQANE